MSLRKRQLWQEWSAEDLRRELKEVKKSFRENIQNTFSDSNQKKGPDWEKTDGLQLAWSQSESRPGICF